MKAVDVNVLVYAAHSGAAEHEAAKRWLSAALGGQDTIGLPWTTILAFVRLVTNPRVLSAPMSASQAIELVQLWLSAPSVVRLEPSSRHLDLLAGLLARSGVAANLVPDAHLAALAIEYGGEVVSFDRGFVRFGVGVMVPE